MDENKDEMKDKTHTILEVGFFMTFVPALFLALDVVASKGVTLWFAIGSGIYILGMILMGMPEAIANAIYGLPKPPKAPVIALLLLGLAAFSLAGTVLFSIIYFVHIENPNPTVIATNAHYGAPFYICKNASISSRPCEFLDIPTSGNASVAFIWSGGNGTVAKAELVDMQGVLVADLTTGQNYTWDALVGTQYTIRVTRLLPNSQMGNLSWADIIHN